MVIARSAEIPRKGEPFGSASVANPCDAARIGSAIRAPPAPFAQLAGTGWINDPASTTHNEDWNAVRLNIMVLPDDFRGQRDVTRLSADELGDRDSRKDRAARAAASDAPPAPHSKELPRRIRRTRSAARSP